MHLKHLSFIRCHIVFRSLSPFSASRKSCCAPTCACTYVALGSWCRSADPAAVVATTVASPWKLTVDCRPSASARFPLTFMFGSPYTAVTCITQFILFTSPLARNQLSLHNSDSQVNVPEKKGNIATCITGTFRHVTTTAVLNIKYLYYASC